MALNEIQGNEAVIIAFLVDCLDAMSAEADTTELLKVHIEYMKEFTDSFEERDIVPYLYKAQSIIQANPNRPIDVVALKVQHNTEAQAGTRKPENVIQELTKWPKALKNPILMRQIFGNVPQGKSSKKQISAITNSKLISKIKAANNNRDILYLVEYFMKFFMLANAKDYMLQYSDFVDRCKELGYQPQTRTNSFQVKSEEGICRDIIGMFLYEDMLDENNREYVNNSIIRFHELYG